MFQKLECNKNFWDKSESVMTDVYQRDFLKGSHLSRVDWQQLSVTLQRLNAIAFRGTFPELDSDKI